MARIEITDLKEDIAITEEELKHVKGGPAYMKLGDIKGEAVSLTSLSSYKLNVQLDGTSLDR
jgi:hypothetical protein